MKLKARNDEEVKAYVDGYNACFNKFRETLLQRNVGTDKAIRKMEMLKEAVNSVLLMEKVGTCQQDVGKIVFIEPYKKGRKRDILEPKNKMYLIEPRTKI